MHRLFLNLVLFAGCFAATSALAATANDGVLLDRVWSGHQVPFALLVEQGHQFVAYYDAERRIAVAGRKLPDGAWSRVRP